MTYDKWIEMLKKQVVERDKIIRDLRVEVSSLRGQLRNTSQFRYVYVIEKDGLIKIGSTSKLGERLRDLKPDRLLLLLDGSYDIERELCQRFSDDVAIGREWFNPTDEIREWIDTTEWCVPLNKWDENAVLKYT